MSFQRRLRYRFDNLMSRGVSAQILLLGMAAFVLILVAGIAIIVTGASSGGDSDTWGISTWHAMTHTLDPGTLGNDTTPDWTYLVIMLLVTIGGIFIVSSLIGVLNQGFASLIENLRRGRSVVMETDHTVILGWSPQIHTLLRELAGAHVHRKSCVVVLADRDKLDMDNAVAPDLHHTHLRVVTRTGNPMRPADLRLVELAHSRSVIVLAPETHDDGTPIAAQEADTVVIKTLLALAKAAPDAQLHVVAEIRDEHNAEVARLVAGERAALILAGPLISRLLVQTGRQSGLSVVYTELLDFEGKEIYIHKEPALAGVKFRDAIARYDSSSLIGVMTSGGETMLPPPLDRVFQANDSVIAISEDEATLVLDGKQVAIDDKALVESPPKCHPKPERTLVLGASRRLPIVLRELDTYVAAGSETQVVGEVEGEPPTMKNMTVAYRAGNLVDRRVLDTLDVTSFDHVLVLSEIEGRNQEMADARTTVTLLHLRDIERIAKKKVQITSEILDIGNRELASVAEADDFIVSNTLISLVVSQVSENPHLVQVFDELFSSVGSEVYLRPVPAYVQPGEHAFGVIVEAAMRRAEIAIGYRLAAHASDSSKGYGVVIAPSKQSRVKLGAGDKVIVLAED